MTRLEEKVSLVNCLLMTRLEQAQYLMKQKVWSNGLGTSKAELLGKDEWIRLQVSPTDDLSERH